MVSSVGNWLRRSRTYYNDVGFYVEASDGNAFLGNRDCFLSFRPYRTYSNHQWDAYQDLSDNTWRWNRFRTTSGI